MKNELIKLLKKTGRFYLMFSGGFDSCSILGCALEANVEVIPEWIDNGFNRVTEKEIREQANNLGCSNLEIISQKPSETVLENPVDRCYH
ncbi:MAG: exoenzyme S synthesis protein B, partial [Prolixibacteraceae bacterium]